MKIIRKSSSFIREGTGKKKKIVRRENWSVTENGEKKEFSPAEAEKFEDLFNRHTSGLTIQELISFDVYETSEGNYSGICNYRENGQHKQHRFREETKTEERDLTEVQDVQGNEETQGEDQQVEQLS